MKAIRLFAALLLPLVMQPAWSQAGSAELIQNASVAQFASMLQDFGYRAEVTTASDGRQRVRTRVGGWNMVVIFYGCTNNESCRSLTFTAFWDDKTRDVQFANEWNRGRRYSKMYIDKEGALVFEYDVLLAGITRAHLRSHLDQLDDQAKQISEAFRAARAAPDVRRPVAIGHVAPLTGGLAHIGRDNENGARLAIEEANSQGVVLDGQPVRFVLVAEDDQADPKVATTVAQKLIDSKVAAVVGHLNSGTTMPASNVYSAAGIPVISGSATNPRVTERGLREVFRVIGRDDQQGGALAAYLARQYRPRTAAIIDDGSAYGQGLADNVERTLKSAGVGVIGRESGSDATADWRPMLRNLDRSSPEVVFFGGMDNAAGPLIRQARELGMRAVFASGDGACTDSVARLAGPSAEGFVCTQAGLASESISRQFRDAYRRRFNTEPILYAAFTYDAASVVIAAMKKAGSADPAKYLPALRQISFGGATGLIAFDDKGDRREAEYTIFTMRQGHVTPVAVVSGARITPADNYAAKVLRQ
jgi:branched-chain amino acid transport system substrate-binding protein